MDLSGLRARIDTVDKKIVDLLNKRLGYVVEIGKIKRGHGQKILDSEREKAVLDAIAGYNKGPLSTQTLVSIFKSIMREARDLEEKQEEANLL